MVCFACAGEERRAISWNLTTLLAEICQVVSPFARAVEKTRMKNSSVKKVATAGSDGLLHL